MEAGSIVFLFSISQWLESVASYKVWFHLSLSTCLFVWYHLIFCFRGFFFFFFLRGGGGEGGGKRIENVWYCCLETTYS